MRRLYIGILVSLIFILGGSLFLNMYRPDVKISGLGKAYHELYFWGTGSRDKDITLVDVNKDKIKIRVQFNDFQGQISIRDIFEEARNRELNNPDKQSRKDVEAFYKASKAKKEVVSYKWVNKPKNIAVMTIEAIPVDKNVNGSIQRIIERNFKYYDDKLSGTIEVDKVNKTTETMICGIGGSGIIEIEVTNVYK